jgi:amyloid beta precursor protein binding protein 1
MIAALKAFTENEGMGKLPLSGSIPDMKSDTEAYVQLLKMFKIINFRFKEKSTRDMKVFKKYLFDLFSKIQKKLPDDDLIERFCKNAPFLKVYRSQSLLSEHQSPVSPDHKSYISQKDDNIIYYYLLRVADRFYQLNGRFPGTYISLI